VLGAEEIFVSAHKRNEVAGGGRKLHDELHHVYCSPNVIGVIK
jgi:hypothetical protein